MLLRDLPTEYRFLKSTHHAQRSQLVHDKTADGANKRALYPNEMATMALNEIAVSQGRGLFLHFPSRESWRKEAAQPGPAFPAIVYVDYVWSSAGKRRFNAESHRWRFQASDGLLNRHRLPPRTPVICLQYASRSSSHIYATVHASVAVFEDETALFLVPVQMLASTLPLTRHTARLQTHRLWQEGHLDAALGEHKQPRGLRGVFEQVLHLHDQNTQNLLKAHELNSVIPRCARSPVILLGTPLSSSARSPAEPYTKLAGPPCRKGKRYRTQPKTATSTDEDLQMS